MGMYTELLLKAQVKADEHGVLKFLFGDGAEPYELPDHEFFTTPRWQMIGTCASFYHHPNAHSDLFRPERDDSNEYYLFTRSDLKNYDGEIGKFLDWLNPYIDELPGTCIGWEWYEEWDEPSLRHKQ